MNHNHKALRELLAEGIVTDNSLFSVEENRLRFGLHGAWQSFRPLGRIRNRPQNVWSLLQRAAEVDVTRDTVLFHEGNYEHNTEDPFICLSGSNAHQFTLTTGNLIGCVRNDDGCILKVSSRFGDDFLRFIIADADGFVEVPDFGGEDNNGGYDWLLIYLWTIKLKKAFRLGLPKAYTTSTGILTTVRGRLDPVDYSINAWRARYHCTYREHSYDNDATRLIARTLEYLDGHDFLRGIHSLNQTFQVATHGKMHRFSELLAAKPLRNPYYADYNTVIALSKRLLRNELSDFGSQSETSAFFFDVSMLFEYFVRKLLKRARVTLREKDSGDWAIPTGIRRNRLIPDLVFDVERRTYVFDVKYKRFDFQKGVKREDIFQIHTYVGQLANECSVGGCGFIYPISESVWNRQGLEATGGIISDTFTQNGRSIPFFIAFIRVPEAEGEGGRSGDDGFALRFRESCQTFVRKLLLALG